MSITPASFRVIFEHADYIILLGNQLVDHTTPTLLEDEAGILTFLTSDNICIMNLKRMETLIKYALSRKEDVPKVVLEALLLWLDGQLRNLVSQCKEINATLNNFCDLLCSSKEYPSLIPVIINMTPRTNNLQDLEVYKLEKEEEDEE
ncbi:hypothetical protein Hypma_005255 [Hypsizygus marmoreus]|uniref:Uncharacterized protein n=1 Tax=Hypsizygus marmoreus TaxID=39966 RepID=A0A369JWS3_HYPMA|nr:hypothetical protein Hypma_005255 [Hypsizygus marmoreus]